MSAIAREAARSQLLASVARAANEFRSLDDVLGVAVQELCDFTDWPVGHVYLVDPAEEGALVPTDLWCVPGEVDVAPFQRVTAGTRVQAPEGLPGRVFASGRPASIRDLSRDENFPRRAAATVCGLRSGHAFPLRSGEQVLGVLEFFTVEPSEIDPELGHLMETVGIELGRALERDRAAAALGERTSLLQATLESTADGILVVDTAGAIHAYNRRLVEMWAIPPEVVEKMQGPSWLDYVKTRVKDPDYGPRALREMSTLEEPRLDEIELVDGRTFERFRYPRYLKEDRTGLVVSFRDVTEQRRAQTEAIESKERLDEAQAIARMGSWEWDVSSGEATCSAELRRLLGVAPHERLSLGRLSAYVYPADLPKLKAAARRVVESGGGTLELTYRYVTPKGAVRWVGSVRNLEVDDEGRLSRIASVDRDVTEKQQAERLLAGQAHVLHMIARGDPASVVLEAIATKVEEEAGDAVCTILVVGDGGRRLFYGSAPSLSDAFRAATDGVEIAEDVGSCGSAAYLKQPVLARDLASDPRWERYRDVARDEGLRSCWSAPITSRSGGEVIGTFALYHRTEREIDRRERDLVRFFTSLAAIVIENERDEAHARELEAQYRHAQKMEAVGLLAGGIAHDFNNLLQAVLSAATLLSESLSPDDPRRADVDTIRAGASKGAELVRQMLTFARREPLEPKVIDLNRCIEKLLPLMHAVLGDALQLDLDLDPGGAHVLVDAASFEQAMLNLITNARDATPPGGGVWVRTRRETPGEDARPGRVLVEVGDTGHGMAPEVAAHAFDPFFTTKGPQGGSGLGLASVYGAVEAAGGRVRIDTTPGLGTTVSVSLPGTDDRPEPPASIEGASGPEARRSLGATILLAEDEEIVAEVLKNALERNGYRVLVASDGSLALEMAMSDAVSIDLVVTDIVMPSLSGFELVRRLRAAGRSVAALYMSGYSREVLERGEVSGPADAYIAKPFAPDELSAAVESLLARQPGRDASPKG